MKPTLNLDFDGVLHEAPPGYSVRLGPPKENARKGCWILRKHFRLVCFTARSNPDEVERWLRANGFPVMPITNIKRPGWILDDHAIRFFRWDQALIEGLRQLAESSQVQQVVGYQTGEDASEPDSPAPEGDLTLDEPNT